MGLDAGIAPAFAEAEAPAGTPVEAAPEALASGPRLQGKWIFESPSQAGMRYSALQDGPEGLAQAPMGSLADVTKLTDSFSYPPANNEAGPIIAESGQCLSILPASTIVNLMPCNGGVLQMWQISPTGVVTAPNGKGLSWRGRHPDSWLDARDDKAVNALRMSELSPEVAPIAFSARVDSKDDSARSALVTGNGTPGATVTINGAQPTQVAAQGNWSVNVTGLNIGTNNLFVEQRVNGAVTGTSNLVVEFGAAQLSASVAFEADLSERATVSGKAERGATVELWQGVIRHKTTVANATTGAYSIALDAPNAGGVQNYTVKQVVSGSTVPGTVDVQADYGSAVVIVAPAAGQMHNGGTLRFEGRGVPGGSVVLTQQGASGVLGTATVASNGIWTINVAGVAKKNLSFTATQTGRGSNVTTATVEINPGVTDEALQVLTPAEGAKLQPGTVTFTGTANAGATIELRSNQTGNMLGTGTAAANGTWSVPVNRQLAAGNYTILVKNGALEVARSFSVEAPAPQLKLEVVNPIAGSRVQPGTVTFTGTANAGAKIELRSNVSGGLLGSGTASASGAWTVDVNRQLGAGEYTIVVKNGTLEVIRSFSVAAPAPKPELAVTAPAQGARVLPGTVTFTGTANAGAKIELRSNVSGGLLGSGTALASGAWAVDVNRQLGAGEYTIVVKNGTLEVARSFTVGENPVTAPLTVTSPANGATLAPGTVTFTGTAGAGAEIELRSRTTGSLLGIGTANTSGNWVVQVNRQLGVDTYYFQVKSGNQTVDRQFTIAEKQVGTVLNVLTPSEGATVPSGRVTFTGIADPGVTVELRSNVSGSLLGQGIANGAGSWTATTTNALGEGTYRVVVKNGGITVDRGFRVKDTPVVGHLTVVTPAQGATVNPGPVTFTGLAEPHAKVVLRSNVSGLELGSGTANAAGNWSATTNTQLGVGAYTVLVQSENNEIARSFQIR
ncbi:hypothetical protein GCM10010471_16710 [Leucobacter komagatae]